MNGAYRYRYAPFLMPIYDALALPLGELSPQVTERSLAPAGRHLPAKVPAFSDWTLPLFCPLRPRCARPPLPQGEARGAGTETVLRPSDFRAARALRGSRKTVNGAYRYRYAPFLLPIYDALALLWESCHPEVTERGCLAPAGRHLPAKVPAFSDWTLPLFALSVLAALGHLSHRERQGNTGTETVLRPSDFRAARALRGSRKTVNGAYRYRYAPFLVPIYDALALPLGELSPTGD